MISTKDLMIGDWVYMEAHRGYEAQYIQVGAIPDASSKDHHGYIGAFPAGGDNDFLDIEDRHLFPIPLTPEILEKNGIELSLGPGGLYQGAISGINCHIEFNIIKYVHELQHALRLCEIEKEIEL